MARYIDADKFLKDETKRCGYIPIIGGCTTDNESLAYRLANAPTAEVVEVRHGKWLLDGRCSECLENPLTTHRTYCPSCGAKMDKNELLENPEQLDLRPISCGAKMDKGVMV